MTQDLVVRRQNKDAPVTCVANMTPRTARTGRGPVDHSVPDLVELPLWVASGYVFLRAASTHVARPENIIATLTKTALGK